MNHFVPSCLKIFYLDPTFHGTVLQYRQLGQLWTVVQLGQFFNISVLYLCTKNFSINVSYCEVNFPIFMTWLPHCEIFCTETVQRCWKIVQICPTVQSRLQHLGSLVDDTLEITMYLWNSFCFIMIWDKFIGPCLDKWFRDFVLVCRSFSHLVCVTLFWTTIH